MMNRLSIEERVRLIKFYYKREENVTLAVRSFIQENKNAPKPHNSTVKNLIEKFERTGKATDDIDSMKRTENIVRTPELVERALELQEGQPDISLRSFARELDVSYGTAHRLRHQDLC